MTADTDDVPPLYDAAQATGLLGVSRRTLQRKVAAGEWPSLKLGGHRYWRPQEINEIRDLAREGGPRAQRARTRRESVERGRRGFKAVS